MRVRDLIFVDADARRAERGRMPLRHLQILSLRKGQVEGGGQEGGSIALLPVFITDSKILCHGRIFVNNILGFDIVLFLNIIRPMKLLSTAEAAAKLGVTIGRVQQLIWDDLLPAQKVGRDYVINEDDLKLVENRPKVGRPPKAKEEKESGKGCKKGGRKK